MLTSFIFVLFFVFSFADEWHSKSQCTQKEFANHMDINCQSNQLILIGWSHYGTKKNPGNRASKSQQQQRCEPSESDCIMDYTHKIAELCNGVSTCEVILTQQFIHKCSDEATYLFISYQCIDNSTIVDVCSKRSMTSSHGLNLISPAFPNEYPNNVNCSCSIESANPKRTPPVTIDVESLSFNLQDNDYLLSSTSLSFSDSLPFGASLLTTQNHVELTFTTDETLSQSGFWIRLHGYHLCNQDEYTLGGKCLKIFSMKQPWMLAEEKCRSIGAWLLRLHDIVEEKKLAHFLLTNNEREQLQSYWIDDTKGKYAVHSWWPWRASSDEGACVLRTQDGWLKRPCDEAHAFICERDTTDRQSLPLTLRCGNAQSPSPSMVPTITTTTTTTIITTTRRPAVPFVHPDYVHEEVPLPNQEQNFFVPPPLPSSYERIVSPVENRQKTAAETKSSAIDPTILAAVLGGVAIAIFSVNIVVCYLCKHRTQKQSKCKTPIESQSSFTHEELQRSLMHHLYHEQTNTISSTSTSSSSSKHSQSKSNDTTTTAMTNHNLLQLSSPLSPPPTSSSSSQPYVARTNAAATALCFRNPHAAVGGSEPVDYHVYETIPSEGTSYALCAAHSAFKPVLQSNTHTIRPFLPRTNILYHPPGSSKQSYDSTNGISSSSSPMTTTVLMPICCHHHSPQCSTTATLRQHIPTQEQIYVGSESIV